MNRDILERILDCPTLPSLPMVAVKVLELTQHTNVRIDELAATIQNDQGLAAKVLKTVNSSFFGLRRPCTTINQAIVMLGLSAVKSLALSFSLVTALNPNGSSEFDFISYWRRGLYTAVAAKCIAHEAGLATEDEAFLGGLLQDVGMVAMFKGISRKYLEVMLLTDGDHRKLVKQELAELELQHPDVGAMLCERWKLPAELIVPVRFHERPTAAPEEYASLVRAVALGNVAHDVLTDPEPAASLDRFRAKASHWFEFDRESCDLLIRRIAEATREVSSLFRLNTGESADAEEILARAQVQLEAINAAPAEETTATNLSGLVSDGDEVDALTGVLTLAAWTAKSERAFEAARSTGKSLTVLVGRVDAFLSGSTNIDPESSDAVLAEVASFLQETVQASGGEVGRYDPSSFCVFMPGVDRADATRTASEIRVAIQRGSATWQIAELHKREVTLSVGVATMEQQDKAFGRNGQLVSAAARAAEVASKNGGNTVRTFVPKLAA